MSAILNFLYASHIGVELMLLHIFRSLVGMPFNQTPFDRSISFVAFLMSTALVSTSLKDLGVISNVSLIFKPLG